ncbi:hypothetical protein [Nesterenkonia sp.]|nr:hypothetical protein [Nesterenkonia sp.]
MEAGDQQQARHDQDGDHSNGEGRDLTASDRQTASELIREQVDRI